MNKKNFTKELLVYVLGMIILTTGLSLSTKLSLGTSALMVLPFSISSIYELDFGNITLIYYLIFITVQILLHIVMKKYKLIVGDALQIVVSFLQTRLLNLFGSLIPMFNSLNNVLSSVYIRIVFLLISIVLIGIGASLVLKTMLPPNPPDGFIKVLSEFTKKNLGTIKNITDITLVIITVIFSIAVSGKLIGVGIGTIMAMLGVGRVIYYFNKTIGKKVDGFLKARN